MPKHLVTVPAGRASEYAPKHPERTTRRMLDWDVRYDEWRTREAMARAIRKHERHCGICQRHDVPLVPLGTTEGYR